MVQSQDCLSVSGTATAVPLTSTMVLTASRKRDPLLPEKNRRGQFLVGSFLLVYTGNFQNGSFNGNGVSDGNRINRAEMDVDDADSSASRHNRD